MTWSVFCDFDGTVALSDTTDDLLERHAAPEWRDLERLWVDGAIGSKECMRRQVELVRATPQQLDALADATRIDDGFPAFVRMCERRSIPVCVISDGLDVLIKRILARHGLGFIPVYANRLQPLPADRYTLQSPHGAPFCSSGTCKCSILDRSAGRFCLLIGDGRSDFCVAEKAADLVLAKDKLLRHCEENKIPHIPFEGFAQSRALVEMMLDSAAANGTQAVSDLIELP